MSKYIAISLLAERCCRHFSYARLCGTYRTRCDQQLLLGRKLLSVGRGQSGGGR